MFGKKINYGIKKDSARGIGQIIFEPTGSNGAHTFAGKMFFSKVGKLREVFLWAIVCPVAQEVAC